MGFRSAANYGIFEIDGKDNYTLRLRQAPTLKIRLRQIQENQSPVQQEKLLTADGVLERCSQPGGDGGRFNGLTLSAVNFFSAAVMVHPSSPKQASNCRDGNVKPCYQTFSQ